MITFDKLCELLLEQNNAPAKYWLSSLGSLIGPFYDTWGHMEKAAEILDPDGRRNLFNGNDFDERLYQKMFARGYIRVVVDPNIGTVFWETDPIKRLNRKQQKAVDDLAVGKRGVQYDVKRAYN